MSKKLFKKNKKATRTCSTCRYHSAPSVSVFGCSDYIAKPFLTFRKRPCPVEGKISNRTPAPPEN